MPDEQSRDPIDEQRMNALISENVKQLRLERDLSQGDLAELLRDYGLTEINQTTISRIEQKKRPVSLVEARALVEVLRTSMSALTASSQEDRLLHAASGAVQRLNRHTRSVLMYANYLEETITLVRIKLGKVDRNKLNAEQREQYDTIEADADKATALLSVDIKTCAEMYRDTTEIRKVNGRIVAKHQRFYELS